MLCCYRLETIILEVSSRYQSLRFPGRCLDFRRCRDDDLNELLLQRTHRLEAVAHEAHRVLPTIRTAFGVVVPRHAD